MKHKDGASAVITDKSSEYGSICGYASTWIRKADAAGDVVKRGAFHKSIEQIEREGRVIPFLFNHKHDDLNLFIGRVTHLEEDENGLLFWADFDNTADAQRARELVKDGRITGFSFAYNILDQGKVTLPDGSRANELRELEILEISLTMYPANRDTSVVTIKTMKNVLNERRRKRQLLKQADRILRESEV